MPAMSLSSIISCACMVAYLLMGLSVYLANPRAAANRLFGLICLDYTIMAGLSMLQYSASGLEACLLLYRIYLPFSFLTIGLIMHFHLALCLRPGRLRGVLIGLGWLPSVLLTVAWLFGRQGITYFENGPFGWYPQVSAANPVSLGALLSFTLFAVAELILVAFWGRRVSTRRERRQAFILVAGNLGSFLASGLWQGLVMAKSLPMPLLPFFTMLVWIGAIFVALRLYGFLGLSLSFATAGIAGRVNEFVALVGRDGRLVEANPRLGELAGRPAAEFPGTDAAGLFGGIDPEWLLPAGIERSGPPRVALGVLWTAQGDSVPVRLQTIAMCNRLGEAEGVLVVGEDLRLVRRLEELNAANTRLLAERELLYRELQHRVKNNLNAIQGLLDLQAGMADDSAARDMMQGAAQRVRSLSHLYNTLWEAGEDHGRSAGRYLSTLVDLLTDMADRPDGVRIEKRIERFDLPVRLLPPLGLLVNELVSNALRHAFVGRASGVVRISAKLRNGQAEIVVADDGVGMPEPGTGPAPRSGFGLELVRNLVVQLGGTHRLESESGTRHSIDFPAGLDDETPA